MNAKHSRSRKRALGVIALLIAGCLLAAGCSSASASGSGSAGARSKPPSTVSRLVQLADGRELYLTCRGRGSPTVVLVSGAVGAHDEWTYVVDAASPEAAPRPSESAVFARVARFTRVCAYDRPGTTLLGDGALASSTPVAQPTTGSDAASDLDALLRAADEPGPYVLAGASWGGMIVNLFARDHPAQVAGIVFVDGASEFLKETLTPRQWAAWRQATLGLLTSAPGTEVPDYEASVAEIRAAAAIPAVPAVVLTSDQPWNLSVGEAGSTWRAWTTAQDRLARLLHAEHVTTTDSGHPINVEQPRVVAAAIHDVVRAARHGTQPTSSRAGG
jgi:pimeloyl-ACP methyl ester carboxylesterase